LLFAPVFLAGILVDRLFVGTPRPPATVGFSLKPEWVKIRQITPAMIFHANGKYYLMVQGGPTMNRAYCFESKLFEEFDRDRVVQLGDFNQGPR